MAARGRVPVRAPGGALGDRRRRADHAPEGAARALPLRLGRRAALDPRACCASTWPSISPTWRHRDERRRLRAVADRLLPRGPARPADRDRLLDAGRAAAARAAARGARARRVAAAGRHAARPVRGTSGGRSRTSSSTAVPSAELAAMREIDATLRIEATGNANALASVDPARMARWARAQAPLREVRMTKRWAITLWPTPAAAQQAGDGHAGARGVRRARAVPRPRGPGRRLGRAARVPGRADLAPGAGARDPHRGPGHRPAPQRRGPDLGQLRRQAQHALRRGLHRAARDVGRGRDPLHDPDRPARRRRRGRDARVPRGTRGAARRPSAATRTCRRRSRPTRAPASWASSGSAPTSASTARSARSSSTRRSAAPSTSRSAAPTRRPAAPTSPSCTGT